LVLAHGFTQNGVAWGPFGEQLARGHRVVAVDLPGHGGSGDVAGDIPAAAQLLGDAGGSADYLGYSLGGRIALHLALARPDLVSRLVLVSTTPGIEDAEARAARRRADEDLARDLDDGPEDGPAEAARLEAFLRRWLSGPLFASLAPEAAMVEARRHNTCAGLASSLRGCGTGTQDPLWSRLCQLAMPVLVVAGDHDARFAAIGARMATAVGPGARLELIPDAGHACHLERPAAVADVVRRFLG
jgi:2-succinyl-6-hydroxy-2,4-cyclohexadiene-1-carboxylate synthase